MFFNRHADHYDSWYDTPLGSFADQVETAAAFDLFRVTPGMSLLDAGCGTGNFSIKLARRGAQVTGTDIAGEMLRIAREKAAGEGLNINFLQMDIYDLQCADASFDAALSMAAFEFIKEPEKAFRELMRVVKPGGQVLIGTINKDSAWGALYEQQATDPTSVFSHACFKTPADLKNLDPDHLIQIKQCLFIPPDTPEEQINREQEKRLSATEKGGFIVALWKKPLAAS